MGSAIDIAISAIDIAMGSAIDVESAIDIAMDSIDIAIGDRYRDEAKARPICSLLLYSFYLLPVFQQLRVQHY